VFFRTCLLWIILLLGTTLPSCSISSRDDHLEKLQRARAFLRDKRYYEVLALLQEIDKDIENSPEYYRIQGVSFFKLKDYHHAVVALEKAKPKSLTLQVYLAYLYLLLGDAKKARALADTIEHQYGQTPEVCILKGNSIYITTLSSISILRYNPILSPQKLILAWEIPTCYNATSLRLKKII
jgi:tetratricopeptide (TPR) repeat protein